VAAIVDRDDVVAAVVADGEVLVERPLDLAVGQLLLVDRTILLGREERVDVRTRIQTLVPGDGPQPRIELRQGVEMQFFSPRLATAFSNA